MLDDVVAGGLDHIFTEHLHSGVAGGAYGSEAEAGPPANAGEMFYLSPRKRSPKKRSQAAAGHAARARAKRQRVGGGAGAGDGTAVGAAGDLPSDGGPDPVLAGLQNKDVDNLLDDLYA